jgi:lipid-A-disaccharide synthase
MINLLAGHAAVPELLQEDCNPDTLARTVLSLLRDPAIAATQRTAFRGVIASLRPPGGQNPSEMAAAVILGLLGAKPMAA